VSPEGPQPIKFDLPRYPKRYLYSGYSGKVSASVTLADDGSVRRVDWFESEPEGIFELDAGFALGRWRFSAQSDVPDREVQVFFCFRSGDADWPAEAPGADDSYSYDHQLPPPKYPSEARKQKIEGQVQIRAYVSPDGRIRRQDVLDSSSPLLTSAAMEGVARWVVHPTGPACAEVPLTIPFNFSLQ